MNTVNILIVDDDTSDSRKITGFINGGFANTQIQVDESLDFKNAMDKLIKNKYDVAIIDHHLADNDGLKLYRTMRSQKLDVPVIFITSITSAETVVEATRLGITEYFARSTLTSEVLCNTIKDIILLKRGISVN